jgi:DNA-binding protein HU-beta
MIDTRAVAKEVQDQLTAAMQKGQEQIRRTRKNVDAALRTGNHLAQAVKPSLAELTKPEKLRASAQELATHAAATQRKLAGNAQEFATQAFAAQRKLTGKALEAASPLLSDGVSRLTQLATSLAPGHRTEHAEPTAPAAVATEPEAAVATEPEPSAPATKSAARARTPRASTRRTSTAKPASTEEKQAKASTRKTSTAKTSTAKASTTTAKARTPKK